MLLLLSIVNYNCAYEKLHVVAYICFGFYACELKFSSVEFKVYIICKPEIKSFSLTKTFAFICKSSN